MNLSYSQLAEDTVIFHLLEHKLNKLRNGFYVDVGAHDPFKYSNTALLRHLGWRGINIEAEPERLARFNAAAPQDINVHAAVSDVDGELTFYEFEGGAPSTCDPEAMRRYLDKGWRLLGSSKVRARTLASILDEHAHAFDRIHLLNIDVEGLEMAVLGSADLSRYAPAVIAVEIHDLDLTRSRENEIVGFLSNAGYAFVAYNLATAIFLRTPVERFPDEPAPRRRRGLKALFGG